MVVEIWKDIKDFEETYQVSNLGNVRTKNDKKHLKQYTIRKYKYVKLCLRGKHKLIRVHRMVAQAFDDTFTNNCVVMHIDNDTINNCIDNLRCGSQGENIRQCMREKRFIAWGHKIKRINQYDLQGNFIRRWEGQTEIIKELGYSQTSISNCCIGKTKTSHGYIWRYENE